jgi:hypothetical protein
MNAALVVLLVILAFSNLLTVRWAAAEHSARRELEQETAALQRVMRGRGAQDGRSSRLAPAWMAVGLILAILLFTALAR